MPASEAENWSLATMPADDVINGFRDINDAIDYQLLYE